MNMEDFLERFFLIIFLLFIIMIFIVIPRIAIITPPQDQVCAYLYGDSYIYESDSDFGHYCIELIFENLTKTNPKPLKYYSESSRRELCNSPKIFELSRWDKGDCL